MARNSQRGSKNNNPEGKNQYSYGYADMARERPLATALGTAAAVGAGVFLWSRRNQISEQLGHLSDQIGEWTSREREFEMAESSTELGSTEGLSSSGTTTTGRKGGARGAGSTGMSETGGGNAALGAHSGGGGMSGNTGRAKA